MSKDLISRQAAIDAFMTATADGDKAEWCKWVINQLPSAQPEPCDGCRWEDAFGYGECHHCKRRLEDMYEREEGEADG